MLGESVDLFVGLRHLDDLSEVIACRKGLEGKVLLDQLGKGALANSRSSEEQHVEVLGALVHAVDEGLGGSLGNRTKRRRH